MDKLYYDRAHMKYGEPKNCYKCCCCYRNYSHKGLIPYKEKDLSEETLKKFNISSSMNGKDSFKLNSKKLRTKK